MNSNPRNSSVQPSFLAVSCGTSTEVHDHDEMKGGVGSDSMALDDEACSLMFSVHCL